MLVLPVFVRMDFIFSLQMTLLKEIHYYLFSLLPWLGWDLGLLPALPASYSGLKVSSSSVRGIQLFGRGSTIYILC